MMQLELELLTLTTYCKKWFNSLKHYLFLFYIRYNFKLLRAPWLRDKKLKEHSVFRSTTIFFLPFNSAFFILYLFFLWNIIYSVDSGCSSSSSLSLILSVLPVRSHCFATNVISFFQPGQSGVFAMVTSQYPGPFSPLVPPVQRRIGLQPILVQKPKLLISNTGWKKVHTIWTQYCTEDDTVWHFLWHFLHHK